MKSIRSPINSAVPSIWLSPGVSVIVAAFLAASTLPAQPPPDEEPPPPPPPFSLAPPPYPDAPPPPGLGGKPDVPPPIRPKKPGHGDAPKEFEKNRERWESMSPEERQFFRERAREFHREMKEEVDAVIRQTGLTLDDAARREFARAYMRGRKQVERDLRQMIEKERATRIAALVEDLKKRFAPGGEGAPATVKPPDVPESPEAPEAAQAP